MAKRSSSSAEQGIACQRALAPCNIQFAAIMHTSICSGSKYKGKEKKKTQPVNNNINCHQWSEQCYKSFLNHRMSMLRKFPFSLKPYVTGRDRGPIGSSCCCTGEAWAGLFLLPSAPHILTAQPAHSEMLTLLSLPTTTQPGPGGRGEWKKTMNKSGVSNETYVT